MEFVKQNFNVQSLKITEVILLPNMWLKDWLTKGKTSKIVTFCYFLPKMGKHSVLISFRYGFSSYLVFNFHSCIYITTTFLLVNVYLMQNMKKSIEIPVSLFFHNIGPTLTQILPQRPHPLYFFDWFLIEYVRGYN